MTTLATKNLNYVSSSKIKEEYMNKAQVEHFEKKLLIEKAALENKISQGVHYLKESKEKVSDQLDVASQNEDLIMELNHQDEAKRELVKVERSLRLIREEDYGFCDNCGIEIGIRRLDARPTSIKCIDCANLEEQRNINTKYRPRHMM